MKTSHHGLEREMAVKVIQAILLYIIHLCSIEFKIFCIYIRRLLHI